MKKLFALLLLVSALSIASTDIQQFDNAQQESDYRALIQELRCPQCQNNNIADSNATIATDMRNKTLELLKQGKSKDEVVGYMVERYGNFVTYDPPITPATILLWLMPLLLIGVGLSIMFKRKKRVQAVSSEQKNANVVDTARLNQILNEKDK
ncbi:cytochrome c-type biogenesis protein CcmH [Glaesserella parasuis]|uniref:Cytochrome c-type biogenesis protein n=1 Tax=Glaesserella parasuis TaxID=738 RepID=A0AA42EEX6_GLAPU|nr:cytochrome c-type biogenesis protein [Glaesserella parasuis]MDD2168292.1 cytochrome c-type biogenesis protein CcmH [Glaesserella parasuis]MDE3965635.1 cytochrome c-type biogenesis protein CcmH [Glaesserella parasuis]MDE3980283.1 cytochrome c-type biogenesis protein CcmH [Glaesserella parasuis]MDG6267061.1 cytochrome c-type biogenesis protein CcmH [Glaesserella parasuis]MDG6294278.1 cytochrome c-type biogenesis protein CcmH [Glaesserella parasuis]